MLMIARKFRLLVNAASSFSIVKPYDSACRHSETSVNATSAFSTVKADDSARRPSEDVTPSVPEPQFIVEQKQDSADWEGRDSQYEAMSQKIVGLIKTRSGGKQEMGDAVVTEEFSRPLPSDRHTTSQSGHDEEAVVAAGALNVKQLQEVFVMYQQQKTDVKAIARLYNVDEELLQRVFHHTKLTTPDQA